MYNVEEIDKIVNKTFEDNKLNKISDNLYLSNAQIEVLERYGIDYRKFCDIKSLIFEVESVIEDSLDCDDLQMVSSELAEFNYYHNTNK